jgi:hypothetical protein
VGSQKDLGILGESIIQCGKDGPDPGVIGDLAAFVNGDVEIHPRKLLPEMFNWSMLLKRSPLSREDDFKTKYDEISAEINPQKIGMRNVECGI